MGWLQARYTFSFGHYFDPKLLGYASLRVLNQEVLAPGAAFQPRTYPKVDILNLILDGEAEYRDSEGNHLRAKAGEALLLSTQPGVSYSEHNLSKDHSLTRMQLWLDACPERENPAVQKIAVGPQARQLLASPGRRRGQPAVASAGLVMAYSPQRRRIREHVAERAARVSAVDPRHGAREDRNGRQRGINLRRRRFYS